MVRTFSVWRWGERHGMPATWWQEGNCCHVAVPQHSRATLLAAHRSWRRPPRGTMGASQASFKICGRAGWWVGANIGTLGQ